MLAVRERARRENRSAEQVISDLAREALTGRQPLGVDGSRLHGPRQVADACLLALAVARGGRLATFDRSLPLASVPGAGSERLTAALTVSPGGAPR